MRDRASLFRVQPSYKMNPWIKYLLSFRLLYMIVGGFVFYLLSIFIDPIFIPALEMPQDFCLKWIETRSGFQKQIECVEFTSRFDELKYRHNRKMDNRRSNKMIGLFIAASVVTFFLMVLNPSLFFGKDITIEDYTGAIATAVFYGIILGFILPVIYQLLLPPAVAWLPEELLEIRNARIELILKNIEELKQ